MAAASRPEIENINNTGQCFNQRSAVKYAVIHARRRSPFYIELFEVLEPFRNPALGLNAILSPAPSLSAPPQKIKSFAWGQMFYLFTSLG